MADRRVALGRVARAHGVRGRVEVRPAGEALGLAREIWIGGVAYRIRVAEKVLHGWILALDGVETREAAEGLRGREVEAAREVLPELPAGEFYAVDLVGCRVVFAGGGEVGEVVGVEEVRGAADLLVVRLESPQGSAGAASGREVRVPVVAGIVVGVDLPAREVRVVAPEGLFDL